MSKVIGHPKRDKPESGGDDGNGGVERAVFFVPMYNRLERLNKTNYAEQMHMALVDIRTNSGDDPSLAERRKLVAMDVLNIPNDIRIDDEFETSCPLEIRTPFLDILYKTFKMITENSQDGLLCHVLANHAHNIPTCIIKRQDDRRMTSWSLHYYWECERAVILYGLRGGNFQKKDYGPQWYKDIFAKEWAAISEYVARLKAKSGSGSSKAGEGATRIKQETYDEDGELNSGPSKVEESATCIKQETDDEDSEEDNLSEYTKIDWTSLNPLKMQVLMTSMLFGTADNAND